MRRPAKKWGDAESAIVRLHYPIGGAVACIPLLPEYDRHQIRSIARSLGLSAPRFATERERFESKFIVTPSCWEWTGGLDDDGYGNFSVNRRPYRAHRYSYELYVGAIPDDLLVCHRCDNRRCVNPDHLWPGTNVENTRDRDLKGRAARNNGELCGRAKLTEANVLEIRADERSNSHIAAAFNVNTNTIRRIKRGEIWAHLLNSEAA